jgi:hypothetical protein
VDALPEVLRELLLYAMVMLAFLGPIEGFLRFRLWRASQSGADSPYLAQCDPWVSAVVVLAGLGSIALVRALS